MKAFDEPIDGLIYAMTVGLRFATFENIGYGYLWGFDTVIARNFHAVSLVSYQLQPQMPRHKALFDTYRKFYSVPFSISDDGFEVKPYRWNEALVHAPLWDERFQLKPIIESDNNLLEVMTPYIGIEYGGRGGEASAILSSRRAFESVRKKLDASIIVNLLHSINPATRFIAIEFLLSNKGEISIEQDMFNNDATIIYKECPRIKTLRDASLIRKMRAI